MAGGGIKAAVAILAAAQALGIALGISFKAGLEKGHQGEIILSAEVDAPEGFWRRGGQGTVTFEEERGGVGGRK